MARGQPPKNVAASVRARLTDAARSRGDDVQLILLRFAIERLIFRLTQSPYADQFILKGAMLFSLWAPVPYRSTGDLDLLGQGEPSPDRLVKVFQDVCAVEVPDDGVFFDLSSVTAEGTRSEEDYPGIRVELNAMIAGARLRVQIDIGFGDVVTPYPQVINYPSLLDFPEAQLRAYPQDTVVAEKLEALVSLGMRNSRMKDFFDLWVMGTTFPFAGPILSDAVRATFARRQTPIPTETPIALTAAFTDDPTKKTQWRAFLRRTKVVIAPEPLPELVAFIAGFALPLFDAAAKDTKFEKLWPAGGPWT